MTSSPPSGWPALRVDDWADTRRTLHMWSQIVGKIRLAYAPLVNHWWQAPLYVSSRGLTTSAIPVDTRVFDLEFDFVDHVLAVRVSDGSSDRLELGNRTVAQFHDDTVAMLERAGIAAQITKRPNEVDPAIPFAEDHHIGYDPAAAHTFWQQLIQADRVIAAFRSRFAGKVSPVHFFWGSFDMACSRFSGRPAPTHPGGTPNCADWVMVEAYSHELSSCGFWPGGGEEGAFYSYAYPEPDGFAEFPGRPDGVFYHPELRQYLLPYETARAAADPDQCVLDFLQYTYDAAAELGGWDRAALEIDPHRWDAHLKP